MPSSWTQTWSRADAVRWFGEDAVAALERSLVDVRGDYRVRPMRTGPFVWIAHADGPDLYFLVDAEWRVARRGKDAFALSLARAMPSVDDLPYVLDVARRLFGAHILDEHEQEPAHIEGARIVFLAMRRRPPDASGPAKHQLVALGADIDARSSTVPAELVRVVVDTDSLSVDVAVLE